MLSPGETSPLVESAAEKVDVELPLRQTPGLRRGSLCGPQGCFNRVRAYGSTGAGGVWKPEAEWSLRQNARWKAGRRKSTPAQEATEGSLEPSELLGMMYDSAGVTQAHIRVYLALVFKTQAKWPSIVGWVERPLIRAVLSRGNPYT